MKFLTLIPLFALTLFASGDYYNRRAPGFSLMDVHFQQHDPADFRGKVLLIDFMQTTCNTCQALTRTIVELRAKYGEKLAVLSIVTSPDTFDTVDKFATEYKTNWPILFDSGQVMMSYLRMTPGNLKVEFPHLFIVDRNGTIRDDFHGFEGAAELSAKIDPLLK